LSEIDLKGLNPDAPEGKGSFTGSLMLHGVKKTVSGPWRFERRGRSAGQSVVPREPSDYNIPEPRYLGVGVKDTVQVE